MATAKKKASKSKSLVLPWKQQLAKYAEEGKAPKEAPATGDLISIKGSKFSFGDHLMGRSFNCVILAWGMERSFFDSPFKEKEVNSPACFALGNKLLGLMSHEDSPNKQGESCDECPLSKWGDDADPDKKPDCAERRRLIVSVKGEDGNIEIKQLTLPPTSLKNWKEFIAKTKVLGLATMQCAVKIYFEESTATFDPICFDILKEITAEKTLQAMGEMLDQANKLLIRPYDAKNYTPPGKGKKAGKKKVAKKKRSKFS